MKPLNPPNAKRIRDIIAAMPEHIRLVYSLHAIEGLSYGEIADELQIDPGDVEQHVARAIVLIDRGLRSG